MPVVHEQPGLDVLLHGHVGEDHPALRHEGNPLGDTRVALEVRHIGAVKLDLPARDWDHADQRLHQRCLAHAVAADDRRRFRLAPR